MDRVHLWRWLEAANCERLGEPTSGLRKRISERNGGDRESAAAGERR